MGHATAAELRHQQIADEGGGVILGAAAGREQALVGIQHIRGHQPVEQGVEARTLALGHHHGSALRVACWTGASAGFARLARHK